MKTKTLVIAQAMRVLAVEIHSNDGVANAAIREAADRLEELFMENGELRLTIECLTNKD